MNPDLDKLQRRLGWRFKDEALLRLALTVPKSHLKSSETNQRLELIGDKILGLVIGWQYYKLYPFETEGILTNLLQKNVNNMSLMMHAERMGLDEFIESAPGENHSKNMADAFEALVGAVFLDKGYYKARTFILKLFRQDFRRTSRTNAQDPKVLLQYFHKVTARPDPVYKELSYTEENKQPQFVCGVFCGDDELGRGSGRTRKEAEANAAFNAVEKLKRDRNLTHSQLG